MRAVSHSVASVLPKRGKTLVENTCGANFECEQCAKSLIPPNVHVFDIFEEFLLRKDLRGQGLSLLGEKEVCICKIEEKCFQGRGGGVPGPGSTGPKSA